MRHDAERRWFLRRYRTHDVEAWLLGWTVEQAIELHDHGGSAAAVIVLEGELVETVAELGRTVSTAARWPGGSVHDLGPTHVHDLRNRSGALATSLHVYSPPLAAMTFYERDAAGDLRAVRVDAVSAEAPWS